MPHWHDILSNGTFGISHQQLQNANHVRRHVLYELLSLSEFVVEIYAKLIPEKEVLSRNVLQLSSHNPPLASDDRHCARCISKPFPSVSVPLSLDHLWYSRHLRCAIFVAPSSLRHLRCAIFVAPSSLRHLRCAIFVAPSSRYSPH